MDKDCSLKKKIFNIIQIGDKSNRISRVFDIFITITIVLNILVTFAQTFDELSRITMGLKAIEYVTLGIFCVEYHYQWCQCADCGNLCHDPGMPGH